MGCNNVQLPFASRQIVLRLLAGDSMTRGKVFLVKTFSSFLSTST